MHQKTSERIAKRKRTSVGPGKAAAAAASQAKYIFNASSNPMTSKVRNSFGIVNTITVLKRAALRRSTTGRYSL
jgi:hypothetical protein